MHTWNSLLYYKASVGPIMGRGILYQEGPAPCVPSTRTPNVVHIDAVGPDNPHDIDVPGPSNNEGDDLPTMSLVFKDVPEVTHLSRGRLHISTDHILGDVFPLVRDQWIWVLVWPYWRGHTVQPNPHRPLSEPKDFDGLVDVHSERQWWTEGVDEEEKSG